MSLLGVCLLGFLLGMSHALEADHLAAVATLATKIRSVREGVRVGVAWGVGHTLTLIVIGSLVLGVDAVVPERLASGLELAVGVMLILLGLDVLRRLLWRRVHFHVHQHGDGTTHLHAHAHHRALEAEDHEDDHHHPHPKGFLGRAVAVGLVHGMAGSAALVLLALQNAPSFLWGIAYIAVFGCGSILGMALLSAVISVPLRWSASSLTRVHNGLEGIIGIATVGIGLFIVSSHWGELLLR